jgi:hypothetical protein
MRRWWWWMDDGGWWRARDEWWRVVVDVVTSPAWVAWVGHAPLAPGRWAVGDDRPLWPCSPTLRTILHASTSIPQTSTSGLSGTLQLPHPRGWLYCRGSGWRSEWVASV